MTRDNLRRTLALAAVAASLAFAAVAQAATEDPTKWEGYIDYAYVYSSADSGTLKKRLAQYGRESGLTLQDYLFESFEVPREDGPAHDEPSHRRLARNCRQRHSPWQIPACGRYPGWPGRGFVDQK